jgi:hypothetical protein
MSNCGGPPAIEKLVKQGWLKAGSTRPAIANHNNTKTRIPRIIPIFRHRSMETSPHLKQFKALYKSMVMQPERHVLQANKDECPLQER